MDLNKYSIEIINIIEKIDKLKNGEYHEILKKPGIPKAMTIGATLEEEFNELIKKISNNAPGAQEIVNESISKLKFIRK